MVAVSSFVLMQFLVMSVIVLVATHVMDPESMEIALVSIITII